MKFLFGTQKKGSGLVEVLVATSIILLVVVGLTYTHMLYLRVSLGNIKQIKAAFLLEEGSEALKLLRDLSYTDNFGSISGGEEKTLLWNGSMWQLGAGNTLIDGFERKIIFGSVMRDNFSDQISASGTVDPDTLKATIYVSWRTNEATTTQSVVTYISNIYDN